MTVTTLQIAGQRFDNEALEEIVDEPLALTLLLAGGALCNDAQLDADSPRETPHAVGDPTEVALVVVA
ncbi:MAG: hypothetical protein KDA55_03335, partial [Planctomycetales bacterium]|nr:hypothetical protein [Planctomycetales bacterium]